MDEKLDFALAKSLDLGYCPLYGLGSCPIGENRSRRLMDSLPDAEREELAHELMKAIHAQGGREMSRSEVVSLLEKPPHLLDGTERLPAGKRGPRTERTRYSLRMEKGSPWRWAWKHYKAVPESRHQAGKPLPVLVERFAKEELARKPNAPSRTLARRVCVAMELVGHGKHIDTIRRALQRLGYLKARNPPR